MKNPLVSAEKLIPSLFLSKLINVPFLN